MEIHPITILLIEDDEEDYILLQKLLKRIQYANYNIVWESTYETGLNRMLTEQHDLCLLDYHLGARTGITLIKEARLQGYVRPIILLTGMDEAAEIDIQAIQAGADDYIDKGQLQGALLHRVIRYAIERKKAELERESLLSEKVAAKELEKRRNEFISMVVHEIKTPMTSLKGYGQLLQRKLATGNTEQTSYMLTRMDAQINKLTGLIENLRDVTRIESGTFQFIEDTFDFDKLVDETIEEIQLTTDRQTICRKGRTGQEIWGDRERVGQVIINFLTNAIKYAPDANTILVKTAVLGNEVIVSVRDFGPGIPEDKQKKIFEPFYRHEESAHRTIPGLGLGLYIAAEIVKLQEGKIWVESEEGEGTTFSFSLPIDRKPQK